MNSSQYLGELPIGIVAAIYVHHIQSPVEAPSSTGAGSLSSNSYLSYSSTTTNNKQQTTTSPQPPPIRRCFFSGKALRPHVGRFREHQHPWKFAHHFQRPRTTKNTSRCLENDGSTRRTHRFGPTEKFDKRFLEAKSECFLTRISS